MIFTVMDNYLFSDKYKNICK